MVKTFDEKWDKLMKVGREREPVIRGSPAHRMPPILVDGLISVARFRAFTPDFPNPDFEGNVMASQQLQYDLTIPKYRLFDEIGMMRGGRIEGTNEAVKTAKFVESLTDIYFKCDAKTKKNDENAFFNCYYDELNNEYD